MTLSTVTGAPGADALVDVNALLQEVRNEYALEEALLQRLRQPRRRELSGHFAALSIMAALVALVFLVNGVFFLLMVASLLLYSYSFVIMLLPTTTGILRPGERAVVDGIEQRQKWMAVRLLLKNRRLAVDLGLTVFLCGMVPLIVGFSLIFGLTLGLAVYLGFVAHYLPDREVWLAIFRIGFILFFYSVVVVLQPRTQAASGRYAVGHGEHRVLEIGGTSAFLIVMMVLVSMVLATTLLGLGSILIPIVNLGELYGSLSVLDLASMLTFVLLLTGLVVTMRHFQGTASRRMAASIVEERLRRMRDRVIVPLERLTEGAGTKGLDELRREFYSLAIFDIGEHDIFGRSPVFLVGPRLRYLLDDRVLSLLGRP